MEKTIRAEVKALNLGKQIKKLRLSREMTLQDMSDLTGLSRPLLSQIENDKASPPIATLLKISHSLRVNISHFFQGSSFPPKKIALVRKKERKDAMRRVHEAADSVGYQYESLAYPMTDKHMNPFIMETGYREESELIFYNHPGEEFLFVMEGKLEFRAGNEIHLLEEGDSLYFDSSIPHAVRAAEKKAAKILAVLYSPD